MGYCNSLLPGFPGYILHLPEPLLPIPLSVWGGISQKCEFSHAHLLLKVHWLSLLKTSASVYGWPLHWPCPLALLNALCSFQPWHTLFFLSEDTPLAFVLNNKLQFYFLQEAFSGFHRPNQWPLYSLCNTSNPALIHVLPTTGFAVCPCRCCESLSRAGAYIFHFCISSVQSGIQPLVKMPIRLLLPAGVSAGIWGLKVLGEDSKKAGQGRSWHLS